MSIYTYYSWYHYWNLSSAISPAIRNLLSRRQSAVNPLYAIYYLGYQYHSTRNGILYSLFIRYNNCPSNPRSRFSYAEASHGHTHTQIMTFLIFLTPPTVPGPPDTATLGPILRFMRCYGNFVTLVSWIEK
jgi:hypothetical protein